MRVARDKSGGCEMAQSGILTPDASRYGYKLDGKCDHASAPELQ